jgi:hypothetical protein
MTCTACEGAINPAEEHHRLTQGHLTEPARYHLACSDAAMKAWRRHGGSIRYIRPHHEKPRRKAA